MANYDWRAKVKKTASKLKLLIKENNGLICNLKFGIYVKLFKKNKYL